MDTTTDSLIDIDSTILAVGLPAYLVKHLQERASKESCTVQSVVRGLIFEDGLGPDTPLTPDVDEPHTI